MQLTDEQGKHSKSYLLFQELIQILKGKHNKPQFRLLK